MALDPPAAQRERRSQQQRRADAESKLLRSALELIAEQGAGRTSLAQIGQRAGFSRGIVNHHFGTKAELVRRLVLASQQVFGDSLSSDLGTTGLDAILALADAYLRRIARPEPFSRAFLVMWAEAAGPGRDLRPAFIDGDRRFRSGLCDLVTQGIGDGSIRADADAVAVATALVAQLRGLGVEMLVDPEGVDLEQARPEIVRGIAAALAAPPGS